MSIRIITAPDYFPEEPHYIQALFESGLECLHLRKPSWSIEKYVELLHRIDPLYYKRIICHAEVDFPLRGFHYKMEQIPQKSLGEVSISCHSYSEFLGYASLVDSSFLSPVFDSISKQGYLGNPQLLQVPHPKKRLHKAKLIALGGVQESNIHLLGDFDEVACLGAIWENGHPLKNYQCLKKQLEKHEKRNR